MSEPELQSLYRRFVKAKRMCGEDPAAVRYETLIKTIDKQLPQLQKIHQGREIEFQVVIRDGRTILKAKPR